jgi:NDP-sugar pyrophosphorylase family protein
MVREVFGGQVQTGLLQVGNKPLLKHIIDRLTGLGFGNMTLVCLKDEEQAYNDFSNKNGKKFSVFSVDGEKTTCDILRMIARQNPASQNHMLIYPIDLITSVNLTSFVDFHIQEKSVTTVFATECELAEKDVKASPGIKASFQSLGKNYFVYDETNPTKMITLLADESALKNDIDLNLKRLRRNDEYEDEDYTHGMDIAPECLQAARSMIVDSSLKSTSSYILAPAAIKFLTENDDIVSLENEFLPRMCAARLKAAIFKDSPKDFTIRVSHYIVLYNVNILCAEGKHSMLVPDGEKEAINDTATFYYKKGKQVFPEGFRHHAQCLYGDNLVVGEKTNIGRTVIGNNCKIGKNVQLQNCVIGDNVTIGDNSQLRNSMVCSESTIPAESVLRQCFAVPNFSSAEPVKEQDIILKSHKQ